MAVVAPSAGGAPEFRGVHHYAACSGPASALRLGVLFLAQTVTISTTTPSATIYYTTNGATPTTNSLVYSGPIVSELPRP